ncbi:RNA binding protein [Plasmodium coatneyi]|uniref:RNA binding protein n=1 Tax=Plasmodium coatneyi TaxID=208452 RepID=A0A1B1DWG8_9APIC|nr:RNA binding protein [Plasmodium coatneyi]ANQ07136.1 RNA binding protein [Plasmodium coatneyi]
MMSTLQKGKGLIVTPCKLVSTASMRGTPLREAKQTPTKNGRRFFSEYQHVQEEKVNLPRLKLRGLPFDVAEEEIKTFFKNFQLAKVGYPIHIIRGVKNKPTGQAHVYFDDEEEARKACETLNRKFLRNRYIEIYTDYIFNHNLTLVKEHVTTLMRDRYRKDNQ